MHGCLEAKHFYQRCSKKDPRFFASLRMTIVLGKKTRIEISDPGFSNLTPPMPFRRITRSLQ